MEGYTERVYLAQIEKLQELLKTSGNNFERINKVANSIIEQVELRCKLMINKLDEVL